MHFFLLKSQKQYLSKFGTHGFRPSWTSTLCDAFFAHERYSMPILPSISMQRGCRSYHIDVAREFFTHSIFISVYHVRRWFSEEKNSRNFGLWRHRLHFARRVSGFGNLCM